MGGTHSSGSSSECDEIVRGRRRTSDGRFLDPTFPPADKALGFPRPGRVFLTPEKRIKVRWLRLPELMLANGDLVGSAAEGPPRLDWCDIQPGDVAQGWLGNCWLIASIAALAEFPRAVQELFVEANVWAGRYVIRLYDMNKGLWEHIEIDDYIPCTMEDDWEAVDCTFNEMGRRVYKHQDLYDTLGRKRIPVKWLPLFGRPRGSKVWALLLEKAMAKFVGSYALLSGGSEPYALTAFTGFPIVYCLQRPALDAQETKAARGRWAWSGAEYLGRQATGMNQSELPEVPQLLSNKDLWRLLLDFDERDFLMTASITRFPTPTDIAGYFQEDGLVLGHAYSLISGKVATTETGETLQLLMLRNPHGKACDTYEGIFPSKWCGPWCEGSSYWACHPEVAEQVGYNPQDDGIFWMPWEDFVETFDKICVLAKSMTACQSPSGKHLKGFVSKRVESVEMSDVCWSLDRMVSQQTLDDIRKLPANFDPFVSMPAFLEDGSLETRMRWEACKPGRLQAWLDLNKSSGNVNGYQLLLSKVEALDLTDALGPKGFVKRPRSCAAAATSTATTTAATTVDSPPSSSPQPPATVAKVAKKSIC